MRYLRIFAVTCALLIMGGSTPVLAIDRPAPSLGTIRPEHVVPVPTSPGIPRRTIPSQEPTAAALAAKASAAPRTAIAAAANNVSLQFLTRPYTTWHTITSVFDHCNPDYTQDGRVCEFDGSTGVKSNGVDPSFSLGYAQSYRGSDYLYYDGHNGWDYALNYENVLSAGDGTVKLAGADPYNPCFGQTIIIDHANNFSTRYAHLSAIYVSPGQSISRGQVIARSGNTGCSSGPHLHFGVYVTSTWTAIDPWGWSGPGADPWPSDQGNLWLTGYAQFPLPSAPGSVTAQAGNGSAIVSWTPPSFNGGSGISSYSVMASPGGITASAGGTLTSTVISGLSNGTSYTFKVTAVNAVGASQSTASNAVTPSAWIGQFRPLTPARILDTRSGVGGFGLPLGQQQSIDVPVTGHGGVPASGVAAVVMNVTAIGGQAQSFLTVYPTGYARPATSSLNFNPGETIANLVEVPVGYGGKVSVYNHVAGVHVVFDVVGWESVDTSTGQGLFRPVAASRVVDSRIKLGIPARIGWNQTVDLQIAGQGGVPSSGVAAVVVNLTVINPTTPGYMTAFPSGEAFRGTSTVNFVSGQTIANRAVVALGSNGKISLYNPFGPADVVVDVDGWFTDSTAAAASASQYIGLTPSRVVDTRVSGGRIGPGTHLFQIGGLGGVPASPTAVVFNITVINPTTGSFLTLYANGLAQPSSSDINFVGGDLRANLAITPLGSDGKLAVYNLAGTTDVVIDVLGYIN